MAMRRVLFLCTHNSARSQMAEGWLRHLSGESFEVHSAGTEATAVRPLAIQAMAEVGVDISGQESKTLERYLDEAWDYVITVCDDANEACPVFPMGQQRWHWSLPDPSQATGTAEQQLAVYRQVRDAIRQHIEQELLSREPVKEEGERMNGDALFEFIVDAFLGDAQTAKAKMFGSTGLKVGNKVFAMMFNGRLVVKLPKQRVEALVASERGEYFEHIYGHGRPWKEWVAVQPSAQDEWLGLAEEARDFVARVGRTKI